MRKVFLTTIVLCTVFFVMAGSCFAQVIYGCAHKNSGDLRIVTSPAQCKSNENLVSWNQVGPQGPTGHRCYRCYRGHWSYWSHPTGPAGSRGLWLRDREPYEQLAPLLRMWVSNARLEKKCLGVGSSLNIHRR